MTRAYRRRDPPRTAHAQLIIDTYDWISYKTERSGRTAPCKTFVRRHHFYSGESNRNVIDRPGKCTNRYF